MVTFTRKKKSYFEEKKKTQNLSTLSLNILYAIIAKILFYAMQYEQPLHQVGIEPVTSGVQGTYLNKIATEFSGLIRVSMYGCRPNKA